ncbi:acetolactate decarboxylase [Halobacteriovorax marinus]|uniref:acetolactate decarboxylase n=1 Tax=Halobacteriovorax marinus TaxID=97084 RepID=UPI003A8D38A8
MHEAIGRGEHQARVGLGEFSTSKEYIGLGAIEKLQGEITILDGNVITTTVGKSNKAIPFKSQSEIQATMLAIDKVKHWREIKIKKDMNQKEFERWLSKQIEIAKLEKKKSFMFKVEGGLLNLRSHVINGSCPVHAKMKKVDIPSSKKPYEKVYERKSGIAVGIYAPNSSGDLTHPGTNIHSHVVLKNEKNEYITSHIETSGVAEGSVIYLPQI